MSARQATVAVAVLVAGLAACGPSPSGTAPPTSATPVTSSPSSVGPSSRSPSPATSSPTSSPATPPPVLTPSPAPTRSPSPTHGIVRPGPDACALTATYLGDDLEVVPATTRIAVLTFDGGASSTGVSSILSTLSRKHAAATFFLTGDFTRDHPGATTAISSGFPVGNHSNTHPDLTTLPSSAVVDEVRRGASAIRAATGRPPGPWFRFPYGARDARTIDLVNDECYVAVRWTVDSLGWKGTTGGMTAVKVRERVLAAARPGMVVLMHVGSHPTDGTTLDAAALPSIIDGLRAKGYVFVTLEQAL